MMKSVLLVDDDNAVLMAIGVRLKQMGYTVYTAKDAVNAVSAVRQNNPDVVVLDISLPAGDGFLVAERLQNLVASAATPVIFITASENPKLRQKAAKYGAAAVPVENPSMPRLWRMPSNRRSRPAAIGNRGRVASDVTDAAWRLPRNSAFSWWTMTRWWFAS